MFRSTLQPAGSPRSWDLWSWALVAAVLGLLLPFVGYVLLPLWGVHLVQSVLTLPNMLLLFVGLVGSVAYAAYFLWVIRRPHWTIYFIVLLWPLLQYGNGHLMDMGINIRFRFLMLSGLVLPALWLGVLHFRVLWQAMPAYKYFLVFMAILTGYFLCFNHHVGTTGWNSPDAQEQGIDVLQFTSYWFSLAGLVLATVSIWRHPNPVAWFDTLNRWLFAVSALMSLITILCYPLNLLSTDLDGFHRAQGFFTQPNPFSHHMGLLLLYQLGVYCYYQTASPVRLSQGLMVASLGVNVVAFLLGLSKGGIFAFSGCALLLLLSNLSSPAVRRLLVNTVLLLVILTPLGLLGFQMVSDRSFWEILESRISRPESLNWRVEVWNMLWQGLDGDSLWLGHGFTGANATILQLTFNDLKNVKPLILVHNGYLALLYDLGLWGLTFFLGAVALLIQGVRRFLVTSAAPGRALMMTLVVLAAYFLIICGVDEMATMFDAGILFWVFSGLIFGFYRRESAS